MTFAVAGTVHFLFQSSVPILVAGTVMIVVQLVEADVTAALTLEQRFDLLGIFWALQQMTCGGKVR